MLHSAHKSLGVLGVFVLVFHVCLPAPRAEAATFVVTKESDDDGPCEVTDCALREAVLAANAAPGKDVIVLPGGTYQLSLVGPVEEFFSMTGDLDIRDDVEIRGDESSPVVIVGDGTDRVIYISRSNVDISHITITGGVAESSGGGISVISSTATITNSTISGNRTLYVDGGGLMVGLSDVTLISTTVSGNTAARSGGES